MKNENGSSIPSPSPAGNGNLNGQARPVSPSPSPFELMTIAELRKELEAGDDQISFSRDRADESFKESLLNLRRTIEIELRKRQYGFADDKTEERDDAQEVAFPEAAWEGPFATWREIVAPVTEAALEKLWASMLIAVGLVLGRNVWLENPSKLHANFFTLLVGQTGNSRKSTVLWLAEQLLSRLDDDVKIIRGLVSTEGIFESLKTEGTRALAYADEWRSVLSVARRKGTSDILPKLNSLFSCPERDEITRKDKSTTIVRPFFSFITATPLQYVEDLLSNAEVAGGVLNRFLIVAGKEQDPKPLVKPPSAEAWARIVEPLKLVGARWERSPRCFELDQEAVALWCEFYIALRKWMADQADTRPVELVSRIPDHVLKIALVYSVLLGEQKISRKTLAIAIALGRWLQASTLNLLGNIGLDPLTTAEREILKNVKPRRWMYRRELQRRMPRKINGELFGRALKSLEANGSVVCSDGTKETPFGRYDGGQVKPWVEYIPLTADSYLHAG